MTEHNHTPMIGRWTRRSVIIAAVGAFVLLAAVGAAVAAWLWTVDISGSVASQDAAVVEVHSMYVDEEAIDSVNGTATYTITDGALDIAINGFTPGDSANSAARITNINNNSIPAELLGFSMSGADVEVIEEGQTPVGDKALLLTYKLTNHDSDFACGNLAYGFPYTLNANTFANTSNSVCLKLDIEMTTNAAPGTVYDLGTGGIDVSSE